VEDDHCILKESKRLVLGYFAVLHDEQLEWFQVIIKEVLPNLAVAAFQLNELGFVLLVFAHLYLKLLRRYLFLRVNLEKDVRYQMTDFRLENLISLKMPNLRLKKF